MIKDGKVIFKKGCNVAEDCILEYDLCEICGFKAEAIQRYYFLEN
jgi:hypothetical protein